MKDYKHVKVPRSYRSSNKRTVTRRVDAGIGGNKRGSAGPSGSFGTVLVVILTAALCFGAWKGYGWMTGAEVFQIAGVDVQGTRMVGDDEVRAMAALFTGQNIFRIDPAAAVRKALANPWVKDVRIERKLPNRISMVFTERTPRVVLQAANGRYLLDESGVVIVPAGESDRSRSLAAISVRDWRAAPGVPVTAEALPEAMALIDALAGRGGWDLGAVTVKADSAETITVLYANREFRIGSGNYEEKLRRLGEIVSDMNRQGIAYSAVELRPERQAAVMVVKEKSKAQGARGKGKKRKG